MQNWDDVRVFLAIARSGSARAAARVLGISQSTISRRLSQLESQSGVRLFDRRPSGLVLTEDGEEEAEELDLLYPDGLPEPEPFRMHIGPIASGAKVIEDPEIFNRLSESMRKVLGVEMEASTVGAVGELRNIPILVAKGVSDFADRFKDDRVRGFAARASAELVLQFLRENFSPHARMALAPRRLNHSRSSLLDAMAHRLERKDTRSLW